MTVKESPYTAAITGGGFLFTETNALLPLLQSPDREALLKDEKLNNRLLKINAETSIELSWRLPVDMMLCLLLSGMTIWL